MIRALVVDDQADVRFLLREVLSHSGVAVEEATNGFDALGRLARAKDSDVVILDVQMPDMDGWDTLAAMRRQEGDEVGIILCTVRSGPDDAVRGYELGCDAFLGKPFDIRELTSVTNTVAGFTTAERVAHRQEALAAAREALEHG